MKQPTTNRELIAAYKRLERQSRAVHRELWKLRDTAARRCVLKYGQIVEVIEHGGRKHWGEVRNITGHVMELRVGWTVELRRVRKTGTLIGGRFQMREDDTRQWKVIDRPKAAA